MPQSELNGGFVVLDSLDDCLKQAQIFIIATPDPVFASLTAGDFKNEYATVTVVDFWRLLQDELEGNRISNIWLLPRY